MSQHLTHNEIKVITAQKTENEFVLDVNMFDENKQFNSSSILFFLKIIMPQHFKFVFLLFDCNVEKLQVRPLDIRLLKIYSNNKPSDEVCSFVSLLFNQSIFIVFKQKIVNNFLLIGLE